MPLIALGRFARRNRAAHVTLEPSSIVRFLEWNFPRLTGRPGNRDAVGNHLGSPLDPATTDVRGPDR